MILSIKTFISNTLILFNFLSIFLVLDYTKNFHWIFGMIQASSSLHLFLTRSIKNNFPYSPHYTLIHHIVNIIIKFYDLDHYNYYFHRVNKNCMNTEPARLQLIYHINQLCIITNIIQNSYSQKCLYKNSYII